MLKQAAVAVVTLALCAPAMAHTGKHHHHKHFKKYTRVVYVTQPVVVVRPVMVEPVVVSRAPNGLRQYYYYGQPTRYWAY